MSDVNHFQDISGHFQDITWGFQSLKPHLMSLLVHRDGPNVQFGFSFHHPSFFFGMEHWPVSYGQCVEVTLYRTRSTAAWGICAQMVSRTQGLHRKENKYVINKGLLKTPLCLYVTVTAYWKFCIIFRCTMLFLSPLSFSVWNIAPMLNKGVSNKVLLIP